MSEERHDRLRAPIWVGLAGAVVLFAVAAIKPLLPEYARGTAGYYWTETLSLFAAEVGVALMVAYIIGLAIDAQARRREERARRHEKEIELRRREAEQIEALEREQRLVQDVFRGVLGIRHSSAYVRKVVETTLEQRVIRRSVNLIYTLRRLTEDEATRIGDADRFMVLDQALSYEFQNLSSEEYELEIRLVVPMRHGKKLRDESGLQAVSIGDVPVEGDELKVVEDEGDAKGYLWKRKMPPHSRLPVALKVRLIKEESDTEVWCSFYPCSEGMTLQVVAPPDLHMGIRNNTASRAKMETDPSDNGVGVWKIEGPILPNDSVVFFWRNRLHEGEDGEGAETDRAPNSVRAIESVDRRRGRRAKAAARDSAAGAARPPMD